MKSLKIISSSARRIPQGSAAYSWKIEETRTETVFRWFNTRTLCRPCIIQAYKNISRRFPRYFGGRKLIYCRVRRKFYTTKPADIEEYICVRAFVWYGRNSASSPGVGGDGARLVVVLEDRSRHLHCSSSISVKRNACTGTTVFLVYNEGAIPLYTCTTIDIDQTRVTMSTWGREIDRALFNKIIGREQME